MRSDVAQPFLLAAKGVLEQELGGEVGRGSVTVERGDFEAGEVTAVIGVPIASTPLGGLDALLSIAQMPKGVPVATVAIGAWGAVNAAILAAQILAVADPAVSERLAAYRRHLAAEVDERARRVAERMKARE